MRSVFVCAVVLAAFAGCNRHEPENGAGSSKPAPAGTSKKAANKNVEPGDGIAYFAGGCFWGVEHYMEQLDGVTSVDSGYMGGHVDSPSYEDVSTQKSGHLETVRVRYNTDKVSYEQVAKLFFEIHDPTQADGQGPDIGPEYMSAVFYTSDEQKRTAMSLIDKLKKRGYNVVTMVRSAEKFWIAEDYHQDYYERKGSQPYCHTRVRRFGD